MNSWFELKLVELEYLLKHLIVCIEIAINNTKNYCTKSLGVVLMKFYK